MTEKNCKSCSKEAVDRVPIMRVIDKLDMLLSKNDLNAADELLCCWEKEARSFGDTRGLLEILNEIIGLSRQTSNKEKGLKAVEDAFKIIDDENMCETVSAGTIYINGATTMKAFGKANEAIAYYQKAREIFEKENSVDTFRRAALLNNMASAYTEIKEFNKAEEKYLSAIKLLKSTGKNNGEIAVSYINLAHLYHDMDIYDERISACMDTAWEYLEPAKNNQDGNYAFICAKCAPAYGFFGYFLQKAELEKRSEEIYGRN